MSGYVPERGDVASVNLNPQTGHEQSGRRPVLVLSPKSYNSKTGLAIVCPLTTKRKGYVFEVAVTIKSTEGAVLADHVKSIDWRARQAKHVAVLPAPVVDRVATLVASLIGANLAAA